MIILRPAFAVSGMLALATFAALPGLAADPAPAASSLPIIGRTHSNAFCSAVRLQFGPAVLGLLKTDEVLKTSHDTLTGMGKEFGNAQHAGTNVADDGRLDIARVKLGAQIHHMTQNIGIAQHFLDGVKSTAGMTPEDAAAARTLRTSMEAVIAKQNSAVDFVNGLVETDLMGQMQLQHDHGMEAATGPEGTHATAEPAPLNAAGLHIDSPSPLPDARTNLTSNTIGGHTPYDTAAGLLANTQRDITTKENVLAPAVIAAAHACGGGFAPPPTSAPHP